MKTLSAILILAASTALAAPEYIDVTYDPGDTNIADRVTDVHRLWSWNAPDNPPGENVLRLVGTYPLPQDFSHTTNMVDDISDPPVTNQVDVYVRVPPRYWKVIAQDVVGMEQADRDIVDAERLETRRKPVPRRNLEQRVQVVLGRDPYNLSKPFTRAKRRGFLATVLSEYQGARQEARQARQAFVAANNNAQRNTALNAYMQAGNRFREASIALDVFSIWVHYESMIDAADSRLEATEFGTDYDPE